MSETVGVAWELPCAEFPALAADEERVYVAERGRVEAFATSDGTRVWEAVGKGLRFEVWPRALLLVQRIPRVAVAYDPATGKRLWTTPDLEGPAFAEFLSAGPGPGAPPDAVVLSGPGRLLRVVDAAKGKDRSRVPLGPQDRAISARLAHDALFVAVRTPEGIVLRRYGLPDGILTATLDAPAPHPPLHAEPVPVFGDGGLLWSSWKETLLCDPATLEVRRRWPVGGVPLHHLLARGPHLFAGGESGLHRLDPASDKTRVLFKSGSFTVQRLAWLGGRVFVDAGAASVSGLYDPETLRRVQPLPCPSPSRLSGRAAVIKKGEYKVVCLGAGPAAASAVAAPKPKVARLKCVVKPEPDGWNLLGWTSDGEALLLWEPDRGLARWFPGKKLENVPLPLTGPKPSTVRVFAWDVRTDRLLFSAWDKAEREWRFEGRQLRTRKPFLDFQGPHEIDGAWLLPGGEPLLRDVRGTFYAPPRGKALPMPFDTKPRVVRADLEPGDPRPVVSFAEGLKVWRFDFKQGAAKQVVKSRLDVAVAYDPAGGRSVVVEGAGVKDGKGTDLTPALQTGKKERLPAGPPEFAPGGGRAAFVMRDHPAMKRAVVVYDFAAGAVTGDTEMLDVEGTKVFWSPKGDRLAIDGHRIAVVTL